MRRRVGKGGAAADVGTTLGSQHVAKTVEAIFAQKTRFQKSSFLIRTMWACAASAEELEMLCSSGGEARRVAMHIRIHTFRPLRSAAPVERISSLKIHRTLRCIYLVE